MKILPYSKDMITATISLFASAGTLICCTLPAVFVTLGAGATLAGLVGNFPQLIWLSENKIFVFGFAALMLVLSGFMQWRARYAPCPADPIKARACTNMRRVSFWVYIFSVCLFLIGGFFAFIAPRFIS